MEDNWKDGRPLCLLCKGRPARTEFNVLCLPCMADVSLEREEHNGIPFVTIEENR